MSDFSVYTAEQIRDWLSQGTIDTPTTNLYVAVFDDTDTERSSEFANGRVQTAAATDWSTVSTGFENNVQIDFGEALNDISNLEDIAIYDDTIAAGGNELARFTMTDAPFDVSSGTELLFGSGTVTFDVVDRTE